MRPYLLRRLGKQKLRGTDTDEFQLDCPLCSDSGKYNLWFNIVKNEGICYKCWRGFRPIPLVQALEDCTFLAAAKIVKELTSPSYFSVEGLKRRVREALDTKLDVTQQSAPPRIELPEEFVLASSRQSKKWPPYLMARIQSKSDIEELGIGWCEDGYYRNRMIVPITIDGNIVSFVARSMAKPCWHCGGKGCGHCDYAVYKAYLYPRGTKTGHLLFNYDRAKHHEHVVLVEGVFDAIRVGTHGLAVLGSHLSDTQLGLLLASAASVISLIFDPDAAGRKATEKTLKKLKPFYDRLRVVSLPGGHDPDFFDYGTLWSFIRSSPLEGSTGAFAARVRAQLDMS